MNSKLSVVTINNITVKLINKINFKTYFKTFEEGKDFIGKLEYKKTTFSGDDIHQNRTIGIPFIDDEADVIVPITISIPEIMIKDGKYIFSNEKIYIELSKIILSKSNMNNILDDKIWSIGLVSITFTIDVDENYFRKTFYSDDAEGTTISLISRIQMEKILGFIVEIERHKTRVKKQIPIEYRDTIDYYNDRRIFQRKLATYVNLNMKDRDDIRLNLEITTPFIVIKDGRYFIVPKWATITAEPIDIDENIKIHTETFYVNVLYMIVYNSKENKYYKSYRDGNKSRTKKMSEEEVKEWRKQIGNSIDF